MNPKRIPYAAMSLRPFGVALFCLSAAVVAALPGGCRHQGDDVDGGLGDVDLSATIDGGNMLVVTPANPVLVVTPCQPLPSVTFTATLDGQPVAAQWQTNRGELGSIDGSGLYLPLGDIGGQATVTATYQNLAGSTVVTVQYRLVENGDPKCGNVGTIGPGGYAGVGGNGPGCAATPPQQTALAGTAAADATVVWLYPYDKTVFPRGLLAPLLMWTPGAHAFDALSLHMESANGTFLYDGTFAKPPGKPFVNLPIPQQTWTTMCYSAGGSDVTITVKLAEGTTLVGPLTVKWRIAPGTLKGIVYYNSYGTALVSNSGENDFNGLRFGAATLGIKPGTTDPVLVAGVNSVDNTGCRVCHTVTKDGGQLITQRGDDYQISRLVDLKNGNLESALTAANAAFPALSPDGKLAFSSASEPVAPDSRSRLYALPSGDLVGSPTGLPANLEASMPVFSPDGTQLAFNYYRGDDGDKRSLAVMSFDAATKTFGAISKIHTPDATYNAVWPSYLPTNKAIVFETETETTEFAYTRNGNKGHLWWIDVASKQAHALDQLNGIGYLPTGPLHASDVNLNYEPTVNPVPSGGYAWVVFTSRRLYGNVATIDPFRSDPRLYDWKNEITTKKLWVAAIDLNGAPGGDPSHPAFYLPAQELNAGNSRGFWTVDPCRLDGAACETGDECCGGYCQGTATPDGGGLTCSSQKPMCAQEFEKCVVDADCCPSTGGVSPDPGGAPGTPALTCINGYCSSVAPPIL